MTLASVSGYPAMQSAQNGWTSSTMKNGSQQTTKVPVTMARVRAAFRSLFCFCFSRPAADAASRDICSLFVVFVFRLGDLTGRPVDPFPVSSGAAVVEERAIDGSGVEEAEHFPGERQIALDDGPGRLANRFTTLIFSTARRIFARCEVVVAVGSSTTGQISTGPSPLLVVLTTSLTVEASARQRGVGGVSTASTIVVEVYSVSWIAVEFSTLASRP